MKLLPVALAVFHRPMLGGIEVWVQRREDDGPYRGLLEFPGGKIEAGELPLEAAVREVAEEVGISVDPRLGRLMGPYVNSREGLEIILYVHLFPDIPELAGKGSWLPIRGPELSSPYQGKIPPPNHQIIDELHRSLYDQANEQ